MWSEDCRDAVSLRRSVERCKAPHAGRKSGYKNPEAAVRGTFFTSQTLPVIPVINFDRRQRNIAAP
ncbi:hypothetical protein GCM10008023_41450 [Sphingomonas glacialis]|uniref:Uncharacterized protein n=1 Tax=Sphingomonas glacialis TaxID=658225 RepID=A0ABQ3LUQ6_9SPHN|nr:hypothetical protein GCM10008023_41450 [Sphingomonas glacialis]